MYQLSSREDAPEADQCNSQCSKGPFGNQLCDKYCSILKRIQGVDASRADNEETEEAPVDCKAETKKVYSCLLDCAYDAEIYSSCYFNDECHVDGCVDLCTAEFPDECYPKM